MERLAGGLRAELSRLAPPDAATLQALADAWAELAGPTAARHSLPQRLASDGTLHVATSSSTWAYELGRLAPTFLDELRTRFGATAPRALRFAPGRLPAAEAPSPDERPEPPVISTDDRRRAASLAAGIADEELRDLVSRAAAAGLARARPDRRF